MGWVVDKSDIGGSLQVCGFLLVSPGLWSWFLWVPTGFSGFPLFSGGESSFSLGLCLWLWPSQIIKLYGPWSEDNEEFRQSIYVFVMREVEFVLARCYCVILNDWGYAHQGASRISLHLIDQASPYRTHSYKDFGLDSCSFNST